ncbi:MAG: DUF3365 domain-containing protein [Steroidobacteraceae bacterium]
MRIETRIALVTAISFSAAALAAGILSYRIEIRQAQLDINSKAEVLIDAASAVRHYTNDEIAPLFTDTAVTPFLPQQVPAYAAQATMLDLHARYPQFQYHEVSVNPTNANDRASDWEAGLLRQLRADDKLTEVVGERGSGNSSRFFVARPLRVTSAACLRCHSVPAAAPAAMLAKYGSTSGFGWKLGDVTALQIVDVPTAPSRRKAFDSVTVTVGSIAATFALIQVLLSFIIRSQIVRPLALLKETARALSMGSGPADPDGPPLPREFDEVRQALGRLSNSLTIARSMRDPEN